MTNTKSLALRQEKPRTDMRSLSMRRVLEQPPELIFRALFTEVKAFSSESR